MISASNASTLTYIVRDGNIPAIPPSTTRTGNTFLDEMNNAVIFAAMRGNGVAYINILGYPQETIEGCISTLEGLSYNVSRDRELDYREISVSWI